MVAALRSYPASAGYPVEMIDVDSDPQLEAEFGDWVPVLFANDERLCHYHLDTLKVDEYLRKTG